MWGEKKIGRDRQTTDELTCGAENVLFASRITKDNTYIDVI